MIRTSFWILLPQQSGLLSNRSQVRTWSPCHRHRVEHARVLADGCNCGDFETKVVERLGELQKLALLVSSVAASTDPDDRAADRTAVAHKARICSAAHEGWRHCAWWRSASRRVAVVGGARSVAGVLRVRVVLNVAALLVGRQVVNRCRLLGQSRTHKRQGQQPSHLTTAIEA